MHSVYGLKPRFQALLRPLVRRLARLGITANQVTVTAMLFSFAVGLTVVRFPTARLPLLLMPLAIFGLGKALPKGEAILVPFF